MARTRKWDVRTDGQMYGTDRGNTECPSAILPIGGGIIISVSFKEGQKLQT